MQVQRLLMYLYYNVPAPMLSLRIYFYSAVLQPLQMAPLSTVQGNITRWHHSGVPSMYIRPRILLT
jgi:hypothetical protein